MGYITQNRAQIVEPEEVSISGQANWLQYAKIPGGNPDTFLTFTLWVNITQAAAVALGVQITTLVITDYYGQSRTFVGTLDANKVGGDTFFIAPVVADTAENLKEALLADDWIRANFSVKVPIAYFESTPPSNGRVLHVRSVGSGPESRMTLSKPYDPNNLAYNIQWGNANPVRNDSLLEINDTTAQIVVDVYRDPDVWLGGNDLPSTAGRLGDYLISLEKTYAGKPVWFDLNGLLARDGTYNPPPSSQGWFDPGTIRRLRAVTKVRNAAGSNEVFHITKTLYVLCGSARKVDNIDWMSGYVYDDSTQSPISFLTNRPAFVNTVKGQTEYLSFLLNNPFLADPYPPQAFSIAIRLAAYSASDEYLGEIRDMDILTLENYKMLNSVKLRLSNLLTMYPTAGIVRASLIRYPNIHGTGDIYTTISWDVEYRVMPDCLHRVRQFTFLNAFGVWEAFNFDAGLKEELKPALTTYEKPYTPDFVKGKAVEAAYDNDLSNTFTVEGAPVTDAVADWLKELASATVILDADGNHIVIDDFTLIISEENRDMQIPTIKYHIDKWHR